MTDAPKAKRPKKLVPVVNPRRQRATKKEMPVKQSSQPRSAAFQELVEAAHNDAEWTQGRDTPRQRLKYRTNVAFGGSALQPGMVTRQEKQRVVWMEPIKTEPDLKKEEIHEEVAVETDDDPLRPMTIPIGQLRDEDPKDEMQRLLPQYIEERLAEVDSDDGCEEGTAEQLGFNSESDVSGGMLFQLPSVFPVSTKADDCQEAGSLSVLPEGRIGKLLIHKSGRVRLKMGDVSMDVNCGTPWPFHQQLVAINVREDGGHCVFLGNVKKRAICTLNISQLLQTENSTQEHEPLPQKRKTVHEENQQDSESFELKKTEELGTDVVMQCSETQDLEMELERMPLEEPTAFMES